MASAGLRPGPDFALHSSPLLTDAPAPPAALSHSMHEPLHPFPSGRASSARAPVRTIGRTHGRRPLLLCLSHLRWDFVWQRPQHLMTRAAREADVVVIEEPIWRPVAAPVFDETSRPGGITVLVPVMPEALPAERVPSEQERLLLDYVARHAPETLIAWYYTPMALDFTRALRPDLIVYDNMDELSGFRGASPAMLANEAALMARADLVFTGGQSLYEIKRHRHPRIRAFPSAIDVPHFAAARDRTEPEPADQAGIPHPRIGYFAVMDERLDVELVASVAALRPEWHFVMIGPVVKIDPETLPRAPNIHWLGPKNYDDLPAYLAGWDLGFMPFARNEATRFISPTKTPEYLAAGVPVVSTPIVDVVRTYGEAGLVAIAADAGGVVAAADRLMDGDRQDWLRRVDAHLASMSWDRTWAEMNRAIEALLTTAGAGEAGRGVGKAAAAF